MKQKELCLNLNRFEKYANRLIPDYPIELKLIELYRLVENEDNSIYNDFTVLVLQYLFKDTVVRPFSDITIFYKEKRYVNIVQSFIDKLTIYLLHHCDPKVNNIVFKEFRVVDNIKMAVFTVYQE